MTRSLPDLWSMFALLHLYQGDGYKETVARLLASSCSPTHSPFHRLPFLIVLDTCVCLLLQDLLQSCILVVDSQFAITCSGDPYRYVRTGAYATILGNEVAVAKLTHSGKWGEPFIRKGADAGTKKVKAARVIYW